MEAIDILYDLTGFADIPTAARILAHRVRAQVAEPLLAAYADSDEPFTTPVSLDLLMEIARACGIRRVEFGSTLASDGDLQASDEGGFVARILHPSYKPRARFTLAHEIAHTFFFNRTPGRRQRLCPYSRRDAYGSEHRGSAAMEEWFCNEFAFELLLPEGSGAQITAEVSRCLSPAEMLYVIERRQRQFNTGIETTLRRLTHNGGLPADMLITILRKASHIKTKQDPAVRVISNFPRPAERWFLPPNRRAASIGLRGADALFEWWNSFPHRRPTKDYKRRSGVFCLDEVNGDFVVYENERMPRGCCWETIFVKTRLSPESSWKELDVNVPVIYRLYAMNTAQAFCAALIDFSKCDNVQLESFPVESHIT